jgi:hypothetical protein
MLFNAMDLGNALVNFFFFFKNNFKKFLSFFLKKDQIIVLVIQDVKEAHAATLIVQHLEIVMETDNVFNHSYVNVFKDLWE